MFLVDTNVLSAGLPASSGQAAGLPAWMERNSARLYLSAITVAEVEEGIAKARRTGAERKADRLAQWLETVLHLYAARVLPLDITVARAVGRLSDAARGSGYAPGLADLVIAATAASHGFTVLTRNVRNFRPLGVSFHDPFRGLPGDVALCADS